MKMLGWESLPHGHYKPHMVCEDDLGKYPLCRQRVNFIENSPLQIEQPSLACKKCLKALEKA